MMKLIVFGAVAFVLGLGGTTGVMVMTAPAHPPGADSTAAHAAPKGAGHAEVAKAAPAAAGHAAPARPAPTPAAGEEASPAAGTGPAADPAAEAHTASAVPHETVVRPPVEPVVRTTRVPAEPDAESYKQVGNILMNMKPAEAAKILAYLSDPQVEGLLRSMSPRNAATLLSQLPSERAAALSRRLLVPRPDAEEGR